MRVVAGAPLDLPGGGTVELGVSIGVATASGGDAEELYDVADAALYTAKRAGWGRAASGSSTSASR